MELDPKEIHEELGDSVLHHIQQLQDEQNAFVKEEKMSMIILDLLVHYPNLQVKILNWFNKLSAMIHIQLMMKLYLTLLFLMIQYVQRIIHDCLKMKQLTSRWVLYPLTHEQRVKLS